MALSPAADLQVTSLGIPERAVSGQSFELTIPLRDTNPRVTEIADLFGHEHERTYGHRADGDPVQIVNIRIVARVPRHRHPSGLPVTAGVSRRRFGGSKREAYFGLRHGSLATPILDRFDLTQAEPRCGPLLIDEYDATTLVPPGCVAGLDQFGNIMIRVGD